MKLLGKQTKMKICPFTLLRFVVFKVYKQTFNDCLHASTIHKSAFIPRENVQRKKSKEYFLPFFQLQKMFYCFSSIHRTNVNKTKVWVIDGNTPTHSNQHSLLETSIFGYLKSLRRNKTNLIQYRLRCRKMADVICVVNN